MKEDKQFFGYGAPVFFWLIAIAAWIYFSHLLLG